MFVRFENLFSFHTVKVNCGLPTGSSNVTGHRFKTHLAAQGPAENNLAL